MKELILEHLSVRFKKLFIWAHLAGYCCCWGGFCGESLHFQVGEQLTPALLLLFHLSWLIQSPTAHCCQANCTNSMQMKLWQCRKSKGGIMWYNCLCKTLSVFASRPSVSVMVLSLCTTHWAESRAWALAQPPWHPEPWPALQVKLLSCVPLSLLGAESSSSIPSAVEAAISGFDSDLRKCSGLSTCHLALAVFSDKIFSWTTVSGILVTLVSSAGNGKVKFAIKL